MEIFGVNRMTTKVSERVFNIKLGWHEAEYEFDGRHCSEECSAFSSGTCLRKYPEYIDTLGRDEMKQRYIRCEECIHDFGNGDVQP